VRILAARDAFARRLSRFSQGFLSSKGLVYGELAPDCVLFDGDGHVRLTDFGVVRTQIDVDPFVVGIARMVEYLAPGWSHGLGMRNCVYWWNLGILGFEMMSGTLPFGRRDGQKTHGPIPRAEINYAEGMSVAARDFIESLLELNAGTSLGGGGGGSGDVAELKIHPLFDGFDWDDAGATRIRLGWIPDS
jgi:serine/threonine protein kinase